MLNLASGRAAITEAGVAVIALLGRRLQEAVPTERSGGNLGWNFPDTGSGATIAAADITVIALLAGIADAVTADGRNTTAICTGGGHVHAGDVEFAFLRELEEPVPAQWEGHRGRDQDEGGTPLTGNRQALCSGAPRGRSGRERLALADSGAEGPLRTGMTRVALLGRVQAAIATDGDVGK
jgi:hypothetical protein